MTADDLSLPEPIAEEIARHLVRYSCPVLSKDEARVFAGLGSATAFDRWAARWGIRPVSHGRYARHLILAALEYEAGKRRQLPAELRRRTA